MPFIHIPKTLTAFFCFYAWALNSQTATFQKQYGRLGEDMANDVIELPDGYLIAGQTTNPASNRTDAFLLRTDKNGDVIWQKSYGQFDQDMFGEVIAANDGGFLAWGSTRDFDKNNTDAWLVKTDNAGNLLWQKTIGAPDFFESARGRIVPVPGGYILSGHQTNPGYSQSFVLRIDNDGNTVWSRFTPSSEYNALFVQYLADGLIHLCGVVNELGCWRTMDPNTGNMVQSLEYQFTTTHRWHQQIPTPDGGHLMSGFIFSHPDSLNRWDGWIHKIGPDGQTLWSKTYRAGRSNYIYTQTLLADGNCVFPLNYFVAQAGGITNSILTKIDGDGKILWAKSFGSSTQSTWVTQVIQTADGGLASVGYTDGGGQGRNVIFLKTDAFGNLTGCCAATAKIDVANVSPMQQEGAMENEAFVNLLPATLPGAANLAMTSQNFCSNVQPSFTQTIKLFAGETITLGGATYSQPDTVTLTLPSTTGGCDTLATYVLGLNCDSTFIKRLTAPGKSSTGQKIVPAPNDRFYLAASVGDKTLIALTDKNMDPIWSRAIDLAPGPEVVLDLRLDAEGRLIGVGNANTVPIGCFAFKMDTATKQVLWRSQLNSPINSFFTRILEKNSGGSGHYFLLGQTDAVGGTGCDALLMEINRNSGELIWDRHYTLGSCEIFNDVFIENNLIYVCGRYNLHGGGQAGFRPALSALDMDGNVQWSRHYLKPAGTDARMYAGEMVRDSDGIVLYGYGDNFGTNLSATTLQLMKTSLTGELLWAKDYDIDGATDQLSFKIRNLPDGYLLSGTFVRAMTVGKELFLIKTDKNGEVQWIRAYGLNGEDRLRDVLVQSGKIYLTGSVQSGSGSDIVLVKLNLDGSVNPNEPCPYVKPMALKVQEYNPLFSEAHTLLPLTVVHNYAVSTLPETSSETLTPEIICAKDCGDPCDDNPNPGAGLPDRTICAGTSETITVPGFAGYAWSPAAGLSCTDCPAVTLSPTVSTPYTLVLTNSAGCTATETFLVTVLPLNKRSETVEFCPGETVFIGGTAYSQPGVVVDTIPAQAAGCDTIVTYTLTYKTANQPNTLQLTCPDNLVYSAPSGTNSLPVFYDLPQADSDCPCPDIQLTQSAGIASGGAFPLGVTTVCYRAEDACGSLKTCCFTVRLDEENACDVKTNGCVRFELVSVNQDAGKNWVYRVRVTNNCPSELAYAYIQVPTGVEAMQPAQNSVYTAPGGSAYTVRNPNFSPFYSLRFKPAAGGIANGQSAVFRYVLPAQTEVDYIHAAVRLASGAYIETHLNTFYCPVGVEPATLPKTADRTAPAALTALQVHPNPAFAGATLRISGSELPDGIFLLQDMAGRTVLERRVAGNQVYLGPEGLSMGIYYFKIIENGRFAGSGKLVVVE